MAKALAFKTAKFRTDAREDYLGADTGLTTIHYVWHGCTGKAVNAVDNKKSWRIQ